MKWFQPEEGESLDEQGGRTKRNTKRKVPLARKSADSKDKSATLIASDTSVRGDVHFSGRLYVSGAVTGNITADEGVAGTVFVDEGGSVEGDIQAAHIIVAGRVEGNVVAGERLEISVTGRVRGDASYKRLGVELGGVVNGRILCVEDEEDRGNVRVFELSGDGDRDT